MDKYILNVVFKTQFYAGSETIHAIFITIVCGEMSDEINSVGISESHGLAGDTSGHSSALTLTSFR